MKTKALIFFLTTALSASLAQAYVFDDAQSNESTTDRTRAVTWTLNRTVLIHLNFFGENVTPTPERPARPFVNFNDAAAATLHDWNAHMPHMQFAWQIHSATSGIRPNPASGSQSYGANLDGDGNNSAIFSQDIYGESFGENTLAVALRTARGNVYVEVDVIFNSKLDWGLYTGAGTITARDFYRVALHEFGHVLGLNHPDQSGQSNAAIMNSISAGLIFELQQDDINGAGALYNVGPARLVGSNRPNLLNLSTRSRVELGDNVMIGGFIIQGTEPATVILRAIGGSLPRFNVAGQLDDPEIELFQGSTRLQHNDDWIDSPHAQTIASYGIEPSNSIESAIYAVLQPGAYTVVVRGLNNTLGVGLVEIFNLQTSNSRAANISTRARVQTGDNVMIAGFIAGTGASQEVLVRGIGPSLPVGGRLADPRIQLVNANGQVIDSNDNWPTDPDAQRMANNDYDPIHPSEAAFIAPITAGSYTVILSGVNNGTGVGLIEVFDLAPPP